MSEKDDIFVGNLSTIWKLPIDISMIKCRGRLLLTKTFGFLARSHSDNMINLEFFNTRGFVIEIMIGETKL